jgi:peptidoglycan hydrolase CwlO-like protein
MKRNIGILFIIASLCIVLAVLSFQNRQANMKIATQAQNASKELKTVNSQLDESQQVIQSQANQIEQLQQENERLALDNKALNDYIDGFWDFMEDKYDFDGHNELYRRTHK